MQWDQDTSSTTFSLISSASSKKQIFIYEIFNLQEVKLYE